MDYKEWIQDRAMELAEEMYQQDYYDLPYDLQDDIFSQAVNDYVDYHAGIIDAAYDRMMDKRALSQFNQD